MKPASSNDATFEHEWAAPATEGPVIRPRGAYEPLPLTEEEGMLGPALSQRKRTELLARQSAEKRYHRLERADRRRHRRCWRTWPFGHVYVSGPSWKSWPCCVGCGKPE